MEINKRDVIDFWNESSCGEELYLKGDNEKRAFITNLKKDMS
jgi:hypothetical protein